MKFWLKLIALFAALYALVSVLLSWLLKRQAKELKESFEHIQPFFLSSSGSQLSPVQVSELENILAESSTDMRARCKLLGYYGRAARSDRDNEKFEINALWLIENSPEHPIVLNCDFFKTRGSKLGYEQGKEIWLRHCQQNPTNTIIIDHAARYFLLQDRNIAQSLWLKAKKLEPKNPKWCEQLAHLYDLGLDSLDDAENARRAFSEKERAFMLYGRAPERLHILIGLPELAFNAREFKKAAEFAQRLLRDEGRDKARDSCISTVSDGKHIAHTVIGRIALRNGDVQTAKQHLQQSADVGGSPGLNVSGPDIKLARDLMEIDERDAVLAFLDRCSIFWTGNDQKLSKWRQEVEAGVVPSQWLD